MWLARFYFLVSTLIYVVRQNSSELTSDEKKAWKFLIDHEEARYNSCMYKTQSGFDMTIHNFTWQNFTDPLLRRAFTLMAQKEVYLKPFRSLPYLNESKRDTEIWNEMRNIFFKSRVCIYNAVDKREVDGNCTMKNNVEIVGYFAKVGNIEERQYYWIAWYNSIGKMRGIYDERIQMFQKLRMFPNYNDWWLYSYEETTESIRQDVDRAWQDILPLYKEFHAYIRRRLISVYGTKEITSNGPIPAHLLDLWRNHWSFIEDIALPYPEEKLNFTEMTKKNNMTPLDLLKLAEDFYHSLGLPYIDDNVWDNTHLSSSGNCGFRFHYTCKLEVSGITACIPVYDLYLHLVIGTIMDVYMSNEKRNYNWPNILTQLPNPSFWYGLRYVGELSSWTTDYLSKIGLIEDIPKNFGQVATDDINILMEVALRFLATIPSTYKVAKWQWDSFDFVISDKDYNKKWWEYSLTYQGICPPVRRTEKHFDPASSREVASNIPAIRDFIAIIYAFQFYKASCEEAGHKDLLHRCNLYGVKTFGDKIRSIIHLGKSIRGREGIALMTNGKSVSLDSKPLLDYFQPLYEWLKKENEEETIGWQSSDPMVCP